ncbi:MAG: hypothetical protein Q4E47_02605 [Candidatus Saccharibacteria bacterium]|nr:hypothetical protein [Candidatus Saccharibacteria bacterium]
MDNENLKHNAPITELPTEAPTRKINRSRITAIVASLCILAIGIVGVILLINRNQSETPEPKDPEPIAEPETPKTDRKSLTYHLDDRGIPGTSYDVVMDGDSRYLSVNETNHCSAVDCESKTHYYNTQLSETDYDKIINIFMTVFNTTEVYDIANGSENMNLFTKLDFITSALSSIAQGNAEFCKTSEGELSCTPEADYDEDGIVTQYEFGMNWLNGVLADFSNGQ